VLVTNASQRSHVSTQDPTPEPVEPRPAMRPDQAAAMEKAEQIIGRREHPEFETSRLKRPQSVLIGCIMAWVGCARLIYAAINWLLVDENSSGIDQTQSATQIDVDVQAAHGVGVVIIVWTILILTFSILAFVGRQWAATTLVMMAALFGLLALVSLVSAFAPSTFLAAFWSASCVTLLRLREPSRDWYAALREWKALRAGA
jgi:hypothetical protein